MKKIDLVKQLEVSKSSIKDLFSDLLNKIRCFKYQITLKVSWKNTKKTEIEFSLVYFDSATKKWWIINLISKLLLKKSYTGLTGLVKNLAGLLSYLSLNTLTLQLKDYYQEVLT